MKKRVTNGIIAFVCLGMGFSGLSNGNTVFAILFLIVGAYNVFAMFVNPFVLLDKKYQQEHDDLIKKLDSEVNEKKSETKIQLEKLESDISLKESEIKTLAGKIKDSNTIYNKLTEELKVKVENDLKNEIFKSSEELNELTVLIGEKEEDIANLKTQINNLESEYSSKTELDISAFEDITSSEIKNDLSLLELEEKRLIDDRVGVQKVYGEETAEDRRRITQLIKTFKAETNQAINSVTVRNIDSNRGRITRSFESLNKFYEKDGIVIQNSLLENKLKQMELVYNYNLKLEQEREQQRYIKEQMAEEERVRREIEQQKKKIEKEERQFSNEVQKLMKYMQDTDNDIEKQLYIDKINELEEKLKQLEIDKEDVLNRESNTRAGFVYVISNIGSFGEDIYKIGMTRRLEPMDRIKELSSASVPFEFDVHAMIFSEDAPTLETTLHNSFRDKEVNKVNPRKEFFKVNLKEIEKVVLENFNATVEFTELAKAEQYRESLRLQKN